MVYFFSEGGLLLTEAQAKYLLTIPADKVVVIQPFSQELETTAASILEDIHGAVPELEVRHMGASALRLSGQGDIDLYIFSRPEDFDRHLLPLTKVFGEPSKWSEASIKWAFERNGFPVEMYLTDPSSEAMQEQIRIFELLRDNTQVRHEYEVLKEQLNGRSFREYQAAKYEFYSALLGKLWDSNEPEADIIELARLLKPGATILDMGAREGRHAFYLAQQGFRVTAVEPELASVRKMIAATKAERVEISAVRGSLEGYQTDQVFDAVVCTYVLHFLTSREAVHHALAKLKSWTKPGGYAAISAYTTKNPPGKRPYLFALDELRNAFNGWEIVYYQEQPTPWFIKPGETEIRRNHAVYLLARRPTKKD